jgi:hypothetical protein
MPRRHIRQVARMATRGSEAVFLVARVGGHPQWGGRPASVGWATACHRSMDCELAETGPLEQPARRLPDWISGRTAGEVSKIKVRVTRRARSTAAPA